MPEGMNGRKVSPGRSRKPLCLAKPEAGKSKV